MEKNQIKTKKTGKCYAMNLLDLFTELMVKKKESASVATATNYGSCINKLHAYLGEQASSFLFQEITCSWVKSWVAWLTEQHPEHPETVDFYFRISRAMYNSVLQGAERKQRVEEDPFYGIKIKMLQPSKRALTVDTMKQILTPVFRESLKPILRESYDILQFIFYANGIVFQDVYNLRWNMINEKRHIRFLRSKTGSYIEICLVPEAWEIIERYRCDDSPFVFPFLHVGKKSSRKIISEQNALRRVNLHASAIGKHAELSVGLTTYVMRHTWATLMLESGKSVEMISQCMGHTNIQTTQIYLSRISSAKVEAGVNDMLNLVRHDFTPFNAKTKLKPERKEPVHHQRVRLKTGANANRICNKHDKLLNHTVYTQFEYNKKDFPFLIKKEKIPLQSF